MFTRIYVTTDLVYRKKATTRTMSVTTHIHAPYPTHIHFCAKYTDSYCLPSSLSLCLFVNDNFVVVRCYNLFQVRFTHSKQHQNTLNSRIQTNIRAKYTNVLYTPTSRSTNFINGKGIQLSLFLPSLSLHIHVYFPSPKSRRRLVNIPD